MSDIIKCPRCDHASGNVVDLERRVTVKCQYCGYPGQRREPRNYDTTIARMAGNIASSFGLDHDWSDGDDAYLRLAIHCVKLARAIAVEVQRTEPEGKS